MYHSLIGLTLPKTVAFVTKKLEEMNIEYTVYEDSFLLRTGKLAWQHREALIHVL